MNTINVEEIYQTLLELLKAYDLDDRGLQINVNG